MKANLELRKKVTEIFTSYYSNPDVVKSILPYHVEGRETCMIAITNDKEYPLKKFRNIKIDSEISFKYNVLNKFIVFKEPYNIYHSCAKYGSGVPVFYFTGDDKEIVKKRQQDWGKTCINDVVSYDLSIDIDSPDFKSIKIAQQDCIKIYESLINSIYIEIRFTGCGFHIVLKNEWRGKGMTMKDFTKMLNKIEKIKEKHSDLVDTHVIEPRRVIKTPNTLVYREGYKNIMICKKLCFDELKKFKVEDCIYGKLPKE